MIPPGSLTVVCGPMYSGKTEELLRRMQRAEYARIPLQLFKPKLDTRYSATDVVSHNQLRRKAECVVDAADIPEMVRERTRIVGIDEVQFFGQDILKAIEWLIDTGRTVIVAGLDMDYLGKPFGSMPTLLSWAEGVEKLTAVCFRCGANATRSYRLSGLSDSPILLGGADRYEARCLRCHREGQEIHHEHP